jgi:hypothetical protein
MAGPPAIGDILSYELSGLRAVGLAQAALANEERNSIHEPIIH